VEDSGWPPVEIEAGPRGYQCRHTRSTIRAAIKLTDGTVEVVSEGALETIHREREPLRPRLRESPLA